MKYQHGSSSSPLLAAMTDAGLFEELATAILRASTPAYRALVHVGTSVAGKPIPAPVDGVGPTADGTPGLLLAHYTTTRQTKLRTKWLAKDGDVPKALRQCNAARKVASALPCTLVLVANSTPSVDVVTEATALTARANVRLDVWDIKRLAQFLDNEPAGQELRQRYFNVPRTLVTTELLAQLSRSSAQALENATLDDPRLWVSTVLDGLLLDRLRHAPLTFLSMPSGSGKTIAAARALRQHVEKGGHGVWVTARIFDDAYSPEHALELLLSTTVQGIDRDDLVGRALSLPSPAHYFVLVIDDIAHCADPDAKLHALLNWARSRTGSGTGPLRVVCPVQTSLLQTLFVSVQNVLAPYVLESKFSQTEAVQAVQLRLKPLHGDSVSALHAFEVAKELGFDPLLIGLAVADGSSLRGAHDVIHRFIDNSLSRCAAVSDTSHLSDFWNSLLALGERMLVEKNVEPLWTEVRSWFAQAPLEVNNVGTLLKQRKVLVARDSMDMQERIGFRHDRVRGWLLARAASRMLLADKLPEEVRNDPYFSEVLAHAISMCAAQRDAPLVGHSTLTLAYILRHRPTGDPLRTDVVARLKAWWTSPLPKLRKNRSLRQAVQWALVDVDGSDALDLLSVLECNRVVAQARLRNGDALGGAVFCETFGPDSSAPFRDQVVQHALHAHGERLVSGLRSLLGSKPENSRLKAGLLYLAGLLRRADLGPAIGEAWTAWGHDIELLHAFIWAGCRCFNQDDAHLLSGPLRSWEAWLNEKEHKKDKSGGIDPVFDLLPSYVWSSGITVAAVAHLIQAAGANPLRRAILNLIHVVDEPSAQELIVRVRAKAEDKAKMQGEDYPFWLSRIHLAQDVRVDRKSLVAAREHVLDLWRQNPIGSALRRQAMEVYLPHATAEDLPLLRSVLSSERALYEDVLFRRVQLGDQQAVPAFIDELRVSETGYLWQAARKCWCPEFTAELDKELRRRRDRLDGGKKRRGIDWIVPELLMELPSTDAEQLLLDHWDHVGNSANFVQAALFVESDATRQLAHRALAIPESARTLLKFLTHRWRIGGTSNVGRFTQSRAQALQPYLALLSEGCLYSVWTAANLDGLFVWRKAHLDKYLKVNSPGTALKSKEGVKGELNRLESKEGRGIGRCFWMRQYEEQGESMQSALAIVGEWLDERKSIEALEVAAECVAEKGSRRDLKILDVPGAPVCPTAEEIREDAQFAVRRRTLA